MGAVIRAAKEHSMRQTVILSALCFDLAAGQARGEAVRGAARTLTR